MAEILALRQQLAILNRTAKRLSLRFQDRLFWVTLARFWQNWRSALLTVKPETVIKWHRQGFQLYWRWKSKAGHPGRPRIDAEIRELIHRLFGWHIRHLQPFYRYSQDKCRTGI